eukprot:m.214199 g.214199  ORF g.214199 m.214199 type:complete len:56 (+) comp17187_c0_seq2:2287-2454(+)
MPAYEIRQLTARIGCFESLHIRSQRQALNLFVRGTPLKYPLSADLILSPCGYSIL